jgi:hypothetical protein
MGENMQLLQMLLERGFLESRAGIDVEENKALFATRKLHFYLRKFSCSLLYLSMVRNDCHLEYEARPWEFGQALHEDCFEALKFIRYVLDQEAVQYEFAKNANRVAQFQGLVGKEPVCWRLLRNIRSYLDSISTREGRTLPKWAEVQGEIGQLERLIVAQVTAGDVSGHLEALGLG